MMLFDHIIELSLILVLGGVLARLLPAEERRGILLCTLFAALAVGPLGSLLKTVGVEMTVPSGPWVVAPSTRIPSVGWLIWITVAATMIFRLMHQLWALERIRQRSRALTSGQIASLPLSLRHLAHCIAISSEAGAGCVVGLWKPSILLPPSYGAFTDSKLAMIIGHEAQHLRNNDGRWLALIELVRSLFWFHPAVHWIVRDLHLAMEDACDAAVVRAGVEPRSYAACLLDAASRESHLPRFAPAMATTSHLLKRRLLLILASSPRSSRLASAGLQAVLVVAGLLLAACGPSRPGQNVVTEEARLRLDADPFPADKP